MHSNATKETTPFIHFKSNVIEASGLSVEAAEVFDRRIHAAFDMGEAVWMIADELRLRGSAPKKMKTPRQLAVRVIAV
jgi:hypothetical protein